MTIVNNVLACIAIILANIPCNLFIADTFYSSDDEDFTMRDNWEQMQKDCIKEETKKTNDVKCISRDSKLHIMETLAAQITLLLSTAAFLFCCIHTFIIIIQHCNGIIFAFNNLKISPQINQELPFNRQKQEDKQESTF